MKKSFARLCFAERAVGHDMPPWIMGLMYLFMDEEESDHSLFDEDQHEEGCSCDKKQGPDPIWNKVESNVTQVLQLSDFQNKHNCFRPVLKEDCSLEWND